MIDWLQKQLKEHLYNVGGSLRRLNRAEDLLWQGDVEQSIALFEGCKFKRAINFLDYLRNHRYRIPEYGYLQQQGLTIGSDAVESDWSSHQDFWSSVEQTQCCSSFETSLRLSQWLFLSP